MDKRILILLGICSFLAATTLTIRYIEVEKKKIKAKFPNLPKEKKIKIRPNTTSVFLPSEEPVIEDNIPAKTIEGTDASLQKEETIQEKTLAPPRDQIEIRTTVPEAIPSDKKQEESIPVENAEEIREEKDVVTPLDEEKNLEDEDTAPVDQEETTPIDNEPTAIINEPSDLEVGENEAARSEEENIIPEQESEDPEIDDEEWIPEYEEEMGEGEEQLPEEEGIGDLEEGELIEEEEEAVFGEEEIFLEEE